MSIQASFRRSSTGCPPTLDRSLSSVTIHRMRHPQRQRFATVRLSERDPVLAPEVESVAAMNWDRSQPNVTRHSWAHG